MKEEPAVGPTQEFMTLFVDLGNKIRILSQVMNTVGRFLKDMDIFDQLAQDRRSLHPFLHPNQTK